MPPGPVTVQTRYAMACSEPSLALPKMTPYISTYRGNRFYPAEPRVEDIDIEDIAHGLAYTCRFNGQTTAFYSVAQHSLIVCELVPESLKREALLHDAAEAYLGDLVKPLKALLPEFVAIEHQVMAAIARAFGLGDWIHPDIKRADRIALATEKRDLMPYSVEPWSELQDVEPLSQPLRPMSPKLAKQAFLDTYARLFEHRASD